MILKFAVLALTALSLSAPLILMGLPHDDAQGQTVEKLGYTPPRGIRRPSRSGGTGGR